MNRSGHRVRVEGLESRLMLCAGTGVQSLSLPLTGETSSTSFDAPAVSVDAAGQALLPDVFPLFSQSKEYVYGWEFDVGTIPGRILMRLTSAVANEGAGAMQLEGGAVLPNGSQEVYQRIFLEGGGSTTRLAGTFTYHPLHEHIHFDNFAAYRLREVTAGNGTGDVAAAGDKISFCLLDIDRFAPTLPGSPPVSKYMTCGQTQGISVGWADVYDKSLPDQWIDVTDVPDGRYWLEVIADPENQLLESDETNNADQILIDLDKPSPDPMVVSHNPVGQYPAPASAVEFTFDQDMNPSSFSLAEDVVAFTGPTGVDLRARLNGVSWTDARTLRISFVAQPSIGPYAMSIGPNVRAADDDSPMDQDRDEIPGESTEDRYAATFTVDNRVGPDAFGYDARAVPVEDIDLVRNAPGVFVLLDNLDEGFAPVPLGANSFNFYGETYSGNGGLFVNTNGLITFGTGETTYGNSNLSVNPTQPSIAALWDDWRTDQGSLDSVLSKFEDTTGDGVPDRLIVEWSDVRRHSDPGPLSAVGVTFQAILSLNTGSTPGAIVFNFRDIDTGSTFSNGADATVGIKGSGAQGGNRLLVSYDRGNHPFVATGRAIRIARAPASVVGRHLFYNRSGFDGDSAAADTRDDAAVAPDKFAYGAPPAPGGRATFANVSAYGRGLNGVMVDLAGLNGRTLQAADFEFRTGAATPAPASNPTISVRRGAGVNSSDRVTLVWPDNAIRNTWLRITVRPTANTGIAAADTFAFGHLAGDAGSASTVGASVDVVDVARTRGAASASTVTVSNLFDHNRDGLVNAFDLGITRANQHAALPWLGASAIAQSSAFTNVPIVEPQVRDLSTRRAGLLLDENAAI